VTSTASHDYLAALGERVLVFDGAMGTNLQALPLGPEHFGGTRHEGCMDALSVFYPEAPRQLHAGFLRAGCDVVETNTFQASRLRLAEWGLAERTAEINENGARIAREMCDAFEARDGRPRFVAGSIGPSGFLPSADDPVLSAIEFEQLVETFAEQASALVQGGADLLIVETQQDILETRAVIHGARRAFARLGREVPLQVQVSLDLSGRMLLGTDISAVLSILEGLRIDVIGLNCSTGPQQMREPLRFLAERSQLPISVIPNAGIPENTGTGRAHYPLDPHGLADALGEAMRTLRVNAVGGCCGSTFDHIEALARVVRDGQVAQRHVPCGPQFASSGLRAVDLRQDPPPTLIGERLNTQGSRQAKRLLLGEQYDELLGLAREQVESGAHFLDVCVALTERADEAAQMQEVVKRLRSSIEAPLVIDTTEPDVIRAALEAYPGRAVINSINLEAGRTRADAVLDLARQHGAAVIALTIDEMGMAHSVDRKVGIARRIHQVACVEHGLEPGQLIFDVLTFPITTGQTDLRDDARASIEAIRQIKAALPGVLTSLGVSNISFGITPAARRILNSVFLHHCVRAGLDMAIVNAAQVTPYAEIPEEQRALAEDLIYNRREDALQRYLAACDATSAAADSRPTEEDDSLPLDERIHQHVVSRKKDGVEDLLDAALQARLATDGYATSASEQQRSDAAVRVLNEVLLPAMKDVGDRFGRGDLILPFVLQSAEVMKRCVRHLEQYLTRQEGYSKGTVVVATVFGDVHDIGKALLITILSNNGYTVHDLGKQVPVNTILESAARLHADAIGLSALLVSTSRQMPVCVQELADRNVHIPVLIGGAAINRAFGRRAGVLRDGTVYPAGVFYCKDVFEGLATLDVLVGEPAERVALISSVRRQSQAATRESTAPAPGAGVKPRTRSAPVTFDDAPIPVPDVWGPQRVPADLAAVWQHLDRNTLFRLHWGGHKARGAAFAQVARDVFEPELARLQREAVSEGWLQAGIVSGAFPCYAEGDALVVFDPVDHDRELARFTFPRQADHDRRCLTDFFRPGFRPDFRPGGNEVRDVVVFQAVTAGARAAEYVEALQREGDYSRMLYVNGLASSTAEALAEYANIWVRNALNLPPSRGLRYSWGYAACPELEDQRQVLRLLRAEELLGLRLSESANLDPEHSTVALVVHHPKAAYFAVRA
jgi:5-methyltetrahydrofolate--homocysteine methyltransferase